MGLERIVKAVAGGLVGYAAASFIVPYYAAYATAARVIGSGVGIYAGATYGSSQKSAHGKPPH